MLTSKQKYDYYVKTLKIVENGWTKGDLLRDGDHCLVGAMNLAVTGDANITKHPWMSTSGSEASLEMQRDFAELVRVKSPRLTKIIDSRGGEINDDDGGLHVIELWNDTPWRRSKTVTNLLQKKIAELEPLVHAEEVDHYQNLVRLLRQRISALQDRVAALEARVTQLENENRFLRKARIKHTAEDLRRDSHTLRELDDELDGVMAKLQELGVDA